eukprot:SAG22_NODE_419_length_10742_cov_2.786902_3_plen_46_part_00
MRLGMCICFKKGSEIDTICVGSLLRRMLRRIRERIQEALRSKGFR